MNIEQCTHQRAVAGYARWGAWWVFPTAVMRLLRNTCLILYSLKVKACFEYTAKPAGYNPSICEYLEHLKTIYFLSARQRVVHQERKDKTAVTKMGL